MGDRQKYCLLALIAVLALLQNAYFLLFYQKGITVDQWDLVPILQQYFAQGNWLELALEQHGGHFHTAAYLLMLPLAKLSNWNLLYEAIAIVLVNFLSFYLLYRVFVQKMVAQSGRIAFILGSIFAALYFSFGHGGNALWSWQLSIYLAVLGAALTLFAYSRRLRPANFALAAFGTTLASFSYSCGFALWPIGAVLILLYPQIPLKKCLTYFFLWLAMGACIAIYYIQNMHNTGMSGDFTFDLANTLLFMLYYLATPIAYFSRDISLLVASIAVVVYLYLAIKLILRKNDYWLYLVVAMGAFAVISGLMISVGRLEFGVDQARSLRYLIFSQFFWFSLLCLIGRNFTSQLQTNSLIQWPLYLLLSMALFTSQKTGRSTAEVAQKNNHFYQQLLETPVNARPVLLLSKLDYPPLEILSNRIEVLDKYDLNFYASD